MRILVGVLARSLHHDTVRRIHTQEWDELDGYHVLTLWGGDMRIGENRFQAVTRKYQELHRIFLGGPYDALLTVEQDMLIPPDALPRLTRLLGDGADVAYGLYVWRYKDQPWWSAHPKIETDAAGAPWFWSMTQYPDEARRTWGAVVRVDGLGFGCTLFSRQTLLRLPFHMRRDDHCCDTTFALDAQAEGLTSVCDTAVVCGHRMDDGRTIWPDPTTPTLYRIEEA